MLKTNSVLYFDSNDFISISHHYIDQANYKLADRAVKMGLNQHPNNVDLMLLNSELLIFNSKYDAAYEILNFVQEIDPENREVYLQKATIYSKNNLSEEAIEILKSALSFIDDKIDVWNMIAMEFLLIEDFESAIPFFKKCLDYDNEDYQSLYNLVFCYENLGLIDESISELSNVLEKRPYSKIAWHQLGKIYIKQGKLKEAISAFDFAIISDDQFVSAYIEKAKILEKAKKYKDALENYKISIQLSEPNSYIFFRISKCYKKLNNKKLFIEFIKKALREEPGNEKAWVYLINFYLKKNNLRQSRYLSKKALDNNHNSLKIIELNAITSISVGNRIEAIRYYKEIIDIQENQSWRIWKSLLKCILEIEEWSELLRLSLRAKKYFPNKSFLDFTISGCLLKNGKLNEAIYFYQSGSKSSKIPTKLRKYFPEFTANKALLV
jgi:tetratricopeptide (TPR) repeat protein